MMEGMDGPHLFEIVVASNDQTQPEAVLRVKAIFAAVGARSGNAPH